MTLFYALSVLARAHTRDDDRFGFTISSMAYPELYKVDEYAEAWKTVRQQLQLQTEPEQG